MEFTSDNNNLDTNILKLDILVDVGLGTWIMFLSCVLEKFNQVHITEARDFPLKNLKILVNTFLLHERIVISTTHKRFKRHYKPNDYVKLFSSYVKFDKVYANGQKIDLGSFSISEFRPMIGIAMYGKKEHAFDHSQIETIKNGFPWDRYYSIDEWLEIVKTIKLNFGYDVITLDSVEEFPTKVLAMFEMCDAIICYEGGMAHLAHALGKPCFIMPWRKSVEESLNDLVYVHALHLDKKTYFLKSITEILNWSKDDFRTKIDELKNNLGNNLILTDPRIKIIFTDSKIKINLMLENSIIPNNNGIEHRYALIEEYKFMFDDKNPLLGGTLPIKRS